MSPQTRNDGLDEFHRLTSKPWPRRRRDAFYMFSSPAWKPSHPDGGRIALFHMLMIASLPSEMQLMGTKNAYYFRPAPRMKGRRARANPLCEARGDAVVVEVQGSESLVCLAVGVGG